MTRWMIVIGCLMVSLQTNKVVGQEPINYNRDVRPILSDNCFLCHGPDEEGRKADLRLDIETEAHEHAFVPGSLEDSESWQRIISDDVDTVMPPPESHKKLSQEDKAILKRWIEAGAKYDEHWSFKKVIQPPVPVVDDPRFARTALDSFIYQGMLSHGLTPSPRASKEDLIRRVTLDLTGLPPTIAEVDAFLGDDSPNAFEKVVDRLLGSPHFGERMAVDWLDIARYGDTSVFHADGPRDMWRWRDWVVDAYNTNMPFDDFTIKQLAGDLLPDKTIEDQIASGFNRNNASTDEGGAIAEEFRVEYAVDRVKTTSMVWMGLSMECAQCHDHKYDPISQEDYYSFFAFFNQAADPGMQTRRGNQAPIVNVLDPEKMEQVPGVEAEINTLKQQLADLKSAKKKPAEKWLASDEARAKTATPPGDTASLISFDEGDKAKVKNLAIENDKLQFTGKAEFPEGKLGKSFRTRGNAFVRSPQTAKDFAGETPISFGCWVKLAGGQSGAPLARMNEGNSHVGFDLYLQGDSVGAHFIHQWPQDAVKVMAKKKLEKGKWHHVFITYDGSKLAKGIKVYVDGEFLASTPSHNSLKGSTLTKVPFAVGRRNNSSQFDGFVDDVRVYNREISASEVAALAQADPLPALIAIAPEERTQEQKDKLFQIYLERKVPEFGQLNKQIAGLQAKVAKLKAPVTSVMVMKDVDKPRMTYVLERGQYDAANKEKPVEANVPGFLPLFEEYEKNRLGMAQWLTSPDHPLTSRVTVNRIWKMFYGTGLVESVGDFGLQGASPSHPELLDWLASDFVSSGWDVKRLIKMIVMSEAYCQSSRVKSQQLELDPGNRFLSRGPRFRLSGEFIRDQALAISGLLNPQMGGPGVKPYQPDGLWNEVSLNGNLRFKRDSGEKLYRRSLYTYWKRSSPPPNMVLFDAPTREKCSIERGNTNTPLQALVLMNDPQFVEAARVFAERILKDGGASVEDKIAFAIRTTTAKEPSEKMVSILRGIYEKELETFQAEAERAKKLLAIGEKKADSELGSEELAAWTIIANLIFNLDEFVTRG